MRARRYVYQGVRRGKFGGLFSCYLHLEILTFFLLLTKYVDSGLQLVQNKLKKVLGCLINHCRFSCQLKLFCNVTR